MRSHVSAFTSVLVATALFEAGAAVSPPPCPCANAAWCNLITTPKPEREIVAFHAQTEHGGAWTTYDWSQITTVIAFGPLPSDLMCHAHSVGARYVFATDVTLTMPDASYIGQASYETAYINAVVDLMVLKRADGINFDQEGYRGPAAALTSLLQRLAAAVRAVNPNAQVSMDLSFNSPQPAYQSWYDVPALANQVDFLVSMAYDLDWDVKPARPVSPNQRVLSQLPEHVFTLMGPVIPGSKWVLGVPWYGRDIPCGTVAAYTTALAAAAGTGRAPACNYGTFPGFAGEFYFSNATATAARFALSYYGPDPLKQPVSSQWGNPFFDYTNPVDGLWHQVWLDTEATLSEKYLAAVALSFRGVAMWNAGFAPWAPTARWTSMWNAIRVNFTQASIARGSPSPVPFSSPAAGVTPSGTPASSLSATRPASASASTAAVAATATRTPAAAASPTSSSAGASAGSQSASSSASPAAAPAVSSSVAASASRSGSAGGSPAAGASPSGSGAAASPSTPQAASPAAASSASTLPSSATPLPSPSRSPSGSLKPVPRGRVRVSVSLSFWLAPNASAVPAGSQGFAWRLRIDAAQRLASVLCSALAAALRTSPHLLGTSASALCGAAAASGVAMPVAPTPAPAGRLLQPQQPAAQAPQPCDGAAAAAGMDCDVRAFVLPLAVVGDVDESPSDYLMPATDRLALRVQAAASDWSALVLAALPELAASSTSVSVSATDASAMVAAAGAVLSTGIGIMASPPTAVVVATAAPQPEASASSTGVAVGVTIAVLVVVAVLAAGLFIRARRRRGVSSGPFRGSMGFGARSRHMDVGEAVPIATISAASGPRASAIAMQPMPPQSSGSGAPSSKSNSETALSTVTVNPISGDPSRRLAAFSPTGTTVTLARSGCGV